MLERLPVVDIRWRHPHLVQAKPKGLEGGASPGQEYQVEVQLRRVGGKKSGSGLARVYAPRFPKVRIVALYQRVVMHNRQCKVEKEHAKHTAERPQDYA